MTILNYSNILQGGGIGAGQKAIGLAGLLQNQRKEIPTKKSQLAPKRKEGKTRIDTHQ